MTWACDRFSHYLLGLPFQLQTDHKPLVPLLGTKPLDDLPLRLMRYHFSFKHVPGKDLITADAASQAPVSKASDADQVLQAEAETVVAAIIDSLPATDKRLYEIRAAQTEDETCRIITQFCKNG